MHRYLVEAIDTSSNTAFNDQWNIGIVQVGSGVCRIEPTDRNQGFALGPARMAIKILFDNSGGESPRFQPSGSYTSFVLPRMGCARESARGPICRFDFFRVLKING
jgi:hypothetical protein